MTSKRRIAGLLAAGAWLLAGLAGCEGRLTEANFDRIQVGMSAAEVEAILGRPGQISAPTSTPVTGSAPASAPSTGPALQTATWRWGEKTITIRYADGKVVQKRSENL